ncbi:MAG: FHA domain-containing protein, partial [Thermoanaerobaculia bacterium]|nr:FHA domain-containing protein [Thermoanaerobaculia bacterium]
MNGWQIFVEVAGRPPFEVRPGESIIGRSRMAQVHINESTVSRQHARILASPIGEVTVEDLGSSNGTYVNNEKIEGRRRLADGDRIHVGDAELRVRIVAPVAASEATVRMSLPPMSAPMGGPPPAVPLAAPLAGPVDLPLSAPQAAPPPAPTPPRAAPPAPVPPVTAP